MKKALHSPDRPEVVANPQLAAAVRPADAGDSSDSSDSSGSGSSGSSGDQKTQAPVSLPERDDFTVKPKFGALVVLCKACQKRSSGPSKLKAKDLRKEMRRDPSRSSLRLRIVESGCLGLCPKKAIAAAAMARGGQMQMAEIKDTSQVPRLLALLQKPVD